MKMFHLIILNCFHVHDDVITDTVEINDEYRLKMMCHLIWLNQKATMLVIYFEYLLMMFSFHFSVTFMCQIICELYDMDFNFT